MFGKWFRIVWKLSVRFAVQFFYVFYAQSFEQRRKYINEVWDVVNEAISEEGHRKDYESKLAEYVELADGDIDKAEVFLYKAYPCAEEYIHPERFDADGVKLEPGDMRTEQQREADDDKRILGELPPHWAIFNDKR